jgi:hypothetical protein
MAMEKQSHLPDKQKKLTPESVMKMLKEKGTTVSILQAEEILKFIRKMAKIVIFYKMKGKSQLYTEALKLLEKHENSPGF